jgi:hypothetical protein
MPELNVAESKLGPQAPGPVRVDFVEGVAEQLGPLCGCCGAANLD